MSPACITSIECIAGVGLHGADCGGPPQQAVGFGGDGVPLSIHSSTMYVSFDELNFLTSDLCEQEGTARQLSCVQLVIGALEQLEGSADPLLPTAADAAWRILEREDPEFTVSQVGRLQPFVNI